MIGSVHRDFRRQAGKVARDTVEAVSAPINAALKNEALTRERVTELEGRSDRTNARVDALEWDLLGFKTRNLLGRLRWLVLGR